MGIGKASAGTFATRVVLFGISAVASILIARLLGPGGRGLYAVLVSFLAVLTLLGNMGISVSNTYYASRSDYALSTLFWNSLLGGLLIGSILSGIALLVRTGAPLLLSGVGDTLFWLGVVGLPVTMALQFLYPLILGIRDYRTYNLILLAQGMVGNTMIVLWLIPWRLPETAMAVSTTMGLVWLTVIIVYFWHGGKVVDRPHFDRHVWWASARYGLKGQVGHIIQYLSYRMDIFLVNIFLGSAATGIYAVAVTLAESLWQLSSSTSLVLLPAVSSSGSQDAVAMTGRSARVVTLGTVMLAGVLSLVVPIMVPWLYGPAFADAVPACLLLLLGILALAPTQVLASFMAGRGVPQYNTYAAMIGFVVILLLDLLLIPRWGINGASVASSFAYLASLIATTILYRRLAPTTNLKDLFIPNREDWTRIAGLVLVLKREARGFLPRSLA